MMKILRHAGAWVLWWIPLFWLWMLFAGDWNRYEIVGGACIATVAASIAEAARVASRTFFLLPPRVLRGLGTAVPMVLVDFGILTLALVRSLLRRERVSGRFVVRDAAGHPPGEQPEPFGERAFVAYAANLSPNAYVVDVDTEAGVVLFHDLVPHRPSEEPA
jgi:multisubunit Na+/H+ antiporter MnhE subunit